MTPKPVITDEMVERFNRWLVKDAGRRCFDPTKDEVIAMLTEVLTPPAEPEIPVSAEMVNAGWKAWNEYWLSMSPTDTPAMKSVFRAMYRVFLEEQKAVCKDMGEVTLTVADAARKAPQSCWDSTGPHPKDYIGEEQKGLAGGPYGPKRLHLHRRAADPDPWRDGMLVPPYPYRAHRRKDDR